jgi:hypothetical protein
VSSAILKFFYGGNTSRDSYGGEVSKLSEGGPVRGSAGIDTVGPVMLDSGEFVIKSSAVRKLDQENPGILDRLNENPKEFQKVLRKRDGGRINFSPIQSYQSGGMVERESYPRGETANVAPSNTSNSDSSSTVNNISINITTNGSEAEGSSAINSGGAGGAKEKEFASKIKNVVLQVISDEQRVGGSLRG